MKAETLTLTITIRPSYADAESVRQEIQESLEWLTSGHDAIRVEWGEVGQGEWPDDEEQDG